MTTKTRPQAGTSLSPDHAALLESMREDINRVCQPIEKARGLPVGTYTSEAWYRFESEHLFATHWSAMCFAADLPDPGSAFPVKLAGMPLVAVRDREGTIRVFHNFCRHRGMRLVTCPQAGVGGLRCPYHSWSYKLDGKLAQTPKLGGADSNTHPDFDRSQYGLVEVRCTVWCGIVFVDVSGKAGDFSQRVGTLSERWQEIVEHPITYPGGVSAFELVVASNWKLPVENYAESYHLPWVHPGLNSYSRIEDHYHMRDEGGGFSGQGTRVYAPLFDEAGTRFPDLKNIDPFWDRGAEYAALFPNVLLGAHRDCFYGIILIPEGPARTVERVHLGFFDPAVRTSKYDSLREKHAETWKEIFVEDVFAVEGMQDGRASSAYDGGVFSPVMDNPTHDFHLWVAKQALAAAA